MNLGVKSVHSKSWTKDIERILGEIESLRSALDVVTLNAIHDEDFEVVRDEDDEVVYENGSIGDNPLIPLRVFETIEELKAEDSRLVCSALTLNRVGTDGVSDHWDKALVASMVTGYYVLASNDGRAFYVSAGRDTKSDFVDVNDLVISRTIATPVWVNVTGDDGRQEGGFFRRAPTDLDVSEHDGVNVIVRNDGKTYIRI